VRLCDIGAAVQEVMESHEVELDGKTYQVGVCLLWGRGGGGYLQVDTVSTHGGTLHIVAKGIKPVMYLSTHLSILGS
jgi:hypothetical protein